MLFFMRFHILRATDVICSPLGNDFPSHHPDPASSPPYSEPALPVAFLRLTHLPFTWFRLFRVFGRQIAHPSLPLDLHFNRLHHPLIDPFLAREIQHPFLIAPFPTLGWLHILEEAGALGPITRDRLRRERIVRRGAEQPGFPLVVVASCRSTMLKLEDLDLAGFRWAVQDDVVGDPGIEPALRVLLMRRDVLLMICEHELLHARMTECDARPASGQGEEPPGYQLRCHEEQASGDEEDEEDGGGERFVGKVGGRRDDLEECIVDDAEVIHAVLQVSHVSEEVLRHLPSRFDGSSRGKRRAVDGVGR